MGDIEKSYILLVKISLFGMKKFEINEPIQCKTFFQLSVFEMSHLNDIVLRFTLFVLHQKI